MQKQQKQQKQQKYRYACTNGYVSKPVDPTAETTNSTRSLSPYPKVWNKMDYMVVDKGIPTYFG